jgi:two-component system sensor histidine kinase NreB
MQLSDVVANAWLNLKLTEKERNRQELLIALNQAQESERARLARELHDGAGQALTSLLLQLKGLQNRSKDPLMGQSLGRMCENVSETIEYIRRLSYQLRPVIIEEFGLETALNDLIDEMSSSAGLNVDFSFGMGDSALPEELNTTLFRICQECLTNIARHAHAKYVTVVLGGDDTHIHIAIEDDGQGFDVEALQHARGRRRLGLASVRERVESLGGSLDVFSAKDEGTRIEATIPMPTGVQDE